MNEINLKLKSYDELIFEITTLNTNKYLLEQKLNKQKEVIDKIKEITKENIDDEFYINLTKKEKALYKIHDLLEEIE